MSLLNDIKKIVTPTIKKVPMKVCMMGPRAVGKTTVLTSIYRESKNAIAESNLVLRAREDTMARLDEQNKKLNAVFAFQDLSLGDKARPSAGIDASSYETTFDFEFGLIGKAPRVDLQFKDFPGEFVLSQPEKVINYIEDSTAVIIAIDTPHLMERSGEFHEVKNCPKQITSIFKSALSNLSSEKLVMFVPLKSEKYFNENLMPDVIERLKSSYKELIEFLSSLDQIACIVAPIKTLGDVQFDKFSFEEDGRVKLDVDKSPFNVLYRFSSSSGSLPQYNPRFCAQPLYNLLSFVCAQYERNKHRQGIFDRLIRRYAALFDSDEPLFNEVRKMEKSRLVQPEQGFVVLSGNHLFQVNK